jgi:hypothetical protein
MAKDDNGKKAKFNLEEYVMVKDRVIEFYEKYPTGRIINQVIEHDREMGFIMIRTEIYRYFNEPAPASTGHAYELKTEGYVNKTSYVENCETSAVGRALAFLSHQVKGSIASREEMEKVERMTVESDPELIEKIRAIWTEGGGTEEQLVNWVKNNNGGLQLEDISGTRQQAMLTRLEAKRAQSQKTETQTAATAPPPPKPVADAQPQEG